MSSFALTHWLASRSTSPAVGAVRHEDYKATGGFVGAFNDDLDDLDFGERLGALGVHVLLDPAIEVVHHKAFTVASLLHNEVSRARRLGSRSVRRLGPMRVLYEGVANVPGSFVVGAALTPAVVATALLPPLWPLSVVVGGTCLALASRFLSQVPRRDRPAFAALLLADQTACLAGGLFGLVRPARSAR